MRWVLGGGLASLLVIGCAGVSVVPVPAAAACTVTRSWPPPVSDTPEGDAFARAHAGLEESLPSAEAPRLSHAMQCLESRGGGVNHVESRLLCARGRCTLVRHLSNVQFNHYWSYFSREISPSSSS